VGFNKTLNQGKTLLQDQSVMIELGQSQQWLSWQGKKNFVRDASSS
jgi:hypothetical protein